MVVQKIIVVSADHLTEIFSGDSGKAFLAKQEISDGRMHKIIIEESITNRMD